MLNETGQECKAWQITRGKRSWEHLMLNDPIRSPQDAWQIVLAYARRWSVETSIRFDKCELTFESPRLCHWETQKRILLIATLA